ncbi:Serine/threonine-protein kinase MRCK gamma [Rhizoctonia solani]|uniref:Serine/threonine-protein kinase MRCK gamma n=1 Tax=Rhizoctonia solani TaxID=456999 RepID=A0A0K6GBR7_9AGAM|nr:Serine/threonine-protein kinase MRCK gamma [Rhizoctonia solani]
MPVILEAERAFKRVAIERADMEQGTLSSPPPPRIRGMPESMASMNIGVECLVAPSEQQMIPMKNVEPTRRFYEPHQASPIESAVAYMNKVASFVTVSDMELSARLSHIFKLHGRLEHIGEPEQIQSAFSSAIRAFFLTPEGHPDLPSRLENLGEAHIARSKWLGNVDDIERSIQCLSRAISLTIDNHPDLPRRLTLLGESHEGRFLLTHSPKDLNDAIEFRSRAVFCAPQDHPELPQLLGGLGLSYRRRFIVLSDPEDIDRAIDHQSRALALTPENHPELPMLLDSLGTCYGVRARQLRNVKDLDVAISFLSRAVSLLPNVHPVLPKLLGNLGAVHTERFVQLGDVKDIESAIELQSRALSFVPEGHPEFILLLESLGISYGNRFQRLGDPNDLEKAIDIHSRALSLIPNGHIGQLGLIRHLAISYGTRFAALGNPKDAEIAHDLLSRALVLTPENAPDFPTLLEHLGILYEDRALRLGDLDDIEQAIKYLTRAVSLVPADHPSSHRRLGALGASYGMRFQWLGELNDCMKSIEYLTRAVSLAPEGHPDLPKHLDYLGTSHGTLFVRLDKRDDIEKAIEFQCRALSLTPKSLPEFPRRLEALGTSFMVRYQRFNRPEDIEHAIEHLSHALPLTPKSNPELPRIFGILGTSHMERFRRLAKLNDIDKAVEYHFQALSLTPENHAETINRLQNLGDSHGVRFKRLAEPDDIEKAIKFISRALSLTPEAHAGVAQRLHGLGTAYIDRFEYLHDPTDLDKAIDHISRALSRTPDGHPSLSNLFQALGVAYKDRYEHFKQPDDLEKAIKYHSQSTSLTPSNYPDFPWRLSSLGSSYRERFQRVNQLADLEQSIECHSRALSLTPEDHPGLPHYLTDLGISLMDKYMYSGDPSYLRDALTHLRKASGSLAGAPRTKLTAALKWARYASTHDQSDCIEAYHTAIELLPQVIWLGATTSQRYQDLRLLSDLAAEAASVAFSSTDYIAALEWLENARCIVWNQMLLLRSPFDELRSVHPELAERLEKSTTGLQRASVEPRLIDSDPFSSSAPGLEAIAQQHRRLAIERDELLSEIRGFPGFEDFLRPKKAAELVHAARNGPVVVINCHKSTCNALILLPGRSEITAISLSGFTHDKAQTIRRNMELMLRSKGLRERGVKLRQELGQKRNFQSVLKVLWDDIVKPVLDSIGYTKTAPTHKIPHITWCPTGAVSFLPLHAAGDYDQPQSRVFDYVTSSYTPTLTALLSSSPLSSNHDSRILGVGQEATLGCSPLPGIVTELESIRNHTSNSSNYSELINDKATKSAVLDAMEHHDWVHLACHASQNVEDPTKSGFHLHDGTLDLATITGRSFKNKGLAFLSACQTATGDEQLPDEAVHLASGMLMTGYPSVIATMWSVSDEDAPFVADKVYGQLMKVGNIGDGEVGRALHNAVAELRGRIGEKEFIRWSSPPQESLHVISSSFLREGSGADLWLYRVKKASALFGDMDVDDLPDEVLVVKKAVRVEPDHFRSSLTYLERDLSEIACIRLVEDMLKGMVYLHSRDPPVAHGLINPGKIYVGSDGRAKLGEFVLSQPFISCSSLAPSINVSGITPWMCPDFLHDWHPELATTQDDMWSFGCTLFEMVTGLRPYHRCRYDVSAVLKMSRGEKPGDLEWEQYAKGDDYPREFVELMRSIISQCWLPAGQRPSAQVLLEKIEAFKIAY